MSARTRPASPDDAEAIARKKRVEIAGHPALRAARPLLRPSTPPTTIEPEPAETACRLALTA